MVLEPGASRFVVTDETTELMRPPLVIQLCKTPKWIRLTIKTTESRIWSRKGWLWRALTCRRSFRRLTTCLTSLEKNSASGLRFLPHRFENRLKTIKFVQLLLLSTSVDRVVWAIELKGTFIKATLNSGLTNAWKLRLLIWVIFDLVLFPEANWAWIKIIILGSNHGNGDSINFMNDMAWKLNF